MNRKPIRILLAIIMVLIIQVTTITGVTALVLADRLIFSKS